MRLEARCNNGKKSLLLLPECEAESAFIDKTLGATIPTMVGGRVELADGYGQHYIELWVEEKSEANPDASPGPPL